tara:strand:+ start:99 stop:548 length:450 start_codon:yes stop_codon:yes gene_type:complete
MKKSFRAQIADDATDRIRLSTNNGLTGYKIVKFQGTTKEPFESDAEHVMKIFSLEPDAANNTINFSDPTLLATLQFTDSSSNSVSYSESITIFDNMVINQDIYVTHVDARGSNPANYYIELEQVKLNANEATVATLKDMRAGPDTNFGP